MHRRISARGVAVTALVATAIALTPGLAAAAQQSPPWFHGADPNCTTSYYAGYKISTTSPPVASRTPTVTYAPVTLTRDSNAPDACFDWDNSRDTNNVPNDEPGWPADWNAGGITLHRADEWCPSAQSTCNYYVTGGNGQDFWFFAGTALDGQGNPDPGYAGSFEQGAMSLPPPGDITLGSVNAVGTADPNGAAGKIRVTASGTADADNKTPFTYDWVLSSSSGKTYTGSSTAADGAFEWTVDEDGQYCVQLTVTAADGYKKSSNACSGGSGGDYVFNITGVAPKKTEPGPNPTPKPGPTPGGGSGGGGGAGAGPTGGGSFFARPARAPTALTGGGATKPTIVWLWRPEWYDPQLSADRAPQTGGTPKLQAHRDIVVSSGEPQGASAGPWLAGLSAFGLLGGGFLMRRRRRLRVLGEL